MCFVKELPSFLKCLVTKAFEVGWTVDLDIALGQVMPSYKLVTQLNERLVDVIDMNLDAATNELARV